MSLKKQWAKSKWVRTDRRFLDPYGKRGLDGGRWSRWPTDAVGVDIWYVSGEFIVRYFVPGCDWGMSFVVQGKLMDAKDAAESLIRQWAYDRNMGLLS